MHTSLLLILHMFVCHSIFNLSMKYISATPPPPNHPSSGLFPAQQQGTCTGNNLVCCNQLRTPKFEPRL